LGFIYQKFSEKSIVVLDNYDLKDLIIFHNITQKKKILSYAKILSQWGVLISSPTQLGPILAQQGYTPFYLANYHH